jgi:hypothetical protein
VRLIFSVAEKIDADLKEFQFKINDARYGAVKDAARLAVEQGRQNIEQAGFSERWQSGLNFRLVGKRNPTALIFHKIGFAIAFERGMTIRGDPLLWLPIEQNLPAGIRSPREYGHKLVSVNIAGRPPMLFDADNRLLGPLFFGTPKVRIRKQWDLYRIFAQAADRLPEFLEERLKGLFDG